MGNRQAANALTARGKRPYHGDMRFQGTILLASAISALGLAQIQAQSPPSPARAASSSTGSPASDGKAQLIAKVQEKFASGEQNFKAGHLEAARRDFNAAVVLMLVSGYDLEGDAELHELFRKVVDTVYTYELQAFHAGDGFQSLTGINPSLKLRAAAQGRLPACILVCRAAVPGRPAGRPSKSGQLLCGRGQWVCWI